MRDGKDQLILRLGWRVYRQQCVIQRLLEKGKVSMTPVAEWTDDCQGKKDYDCPFIELTTRYWPRGGGFDVLNIVPGRPVEHRGNETRPGIKPSARADIVIRCREELDGDLSLEGDPSPHPPSVTLAGRDFEGESFEEVKAAVEAWTQQQFNFITNVLKAAYAAR